MDFSFSDFTIKDEIKAKYSDIIELIFKSITIETKEQKQYWIDALEEMDDEQIKNLREILTEEIDQVKQIDEEFWEKITEAEQDAISRIKLKESEKRKQKREEEEKLSQGKESSYEDDLLSQLDDL